MGWPPLVTIIPCVFGTSAKGGACTTCSRTTSLFLRSASRRVKGGSCSRPVTTTRSRSGTPPIGESSRCSSDTKVVSWAQTTSPRASTGTITSVPLASIVRSSFGRHRGKQRRRWMHRPSCERDCRQHQRSQEEESTSQHPEHLKSIGLNPYVIGAVHLPNKCMIPSGQGPSPPPNSS